MPKPTKPAKQEKSPKSARIETETKIANIRRRLQEIRDYKRILADDGIEADSEDKRLESELIVRLLYLEKQLKGPPPPRPPAGQGKGKNKPGRGKKKGLGEGKKPRKGPRNAAKNAAKKKARTSGR